MVLDDARQTLAADHADARAALLHGDQQRNLIKRGPQLPQTELGARLRIGGDARRVVVRRPGDEAGAEHLEEAHDGPPGTRRLFTFVRTQSPRPPLAVAIRRESKSGRAPVSRRFDCSRRCVSWPFSCGVRTGAPALAREVGAIARRQDAVGRVPPTARTRRDTAPASHFRRNTPETRCRSPQRRRRSALRRCARPHGAGR